MPDKVLICEDEPDMIVGLEDTLVHEGYEVVTADNGREGLQIAIEQAPDLIILDVMMPEMNGYEVLESLRHRGVRTPVIMLTARDAVDDKVQGLEIGADDYLTKPFNMKELVARIKAVQRRSADRPERIREYRFGKVHVDFDHQTLTKGRKSVKLSSCENELLRLLVMRRGDAVSRNQILTEVWGYEYPPDTRTVDNHIVRLRQKLEDDPRSPKHILTAHGTGYKFVE
jgi:DNA-binding response OmpR family regulator